MNEDMSEMMKNFSKMMNNNEMPEGIKNILNSMSNSGIGNSSNNFTGTSVDNNSDDNFNNGQNESSNTSSTKNPFENIDLNTIMKIQKIMSSMKDTQNDSRTNLLLSLKPYLKESRKNKVDQYIQLMKMEKIFEAMGPLGGDNKNV